MPAGSENHMVICSENMAQPNTVISMVVEMVPLKGGIGSIFHPPEGKDYKWYISGIYGI